MKKSEMQQHITDLVEKLDIEDFLYQDTMKFLESLSYYKLQNVYKNKDKFTQHLKEVQASYEQHCQQEEDEEQLSDKEFLGVDVAENTKKEKNNTMQAMYAVRGYFLFTVAEFAYGTDLRIKLRDRLKENITI